MNNYTLDPSKQEATATSTPASVAASAPAPTHAAHPFYMPPNYPHPYYPYQYPQVAAPVTPSADVSKIRDWLPWSIINLFIGGLLPGLIPLIFSLICRSHKKKNNVSSAKTMSTLALVFNILITVIGIAALVGIFIYLFVYNQQMVREYYRKY